MTDTELIEALAEQLYFIAGLAVNLTKPGVDVETKRLLNLAYDRLTGQTQEEGGWR